MIESCFYAENGRFTTRISYESDLDKKFINNYRLSKIKVIDEICSLFKGAGFMPTFHGRVERDRDDVYSLDFSFVDDDALFERVCGYKDAEPLVCTVDKFREIQNLDISREDVLVKYIAAVIGAHIDCRIAYMNYEHRKDCLIGLYLKKLPSATYSLDSLYLKESLEKILYSRIEGFTLTHHALLSDILIVEGNIKR